MANYTVVVTDHDFDDLSIEQDILDGIADVTAVADGVDVDDKAVREALRDADGVLNLRHDLDAADIEAAADCRIVARYGIGVDNVDIEAATERGIYVTNVPEYCLEEVSTHALTLLLGLLRGLPQYQRSVAAGEWEREAAPPMHRLSTRTVGVVGFGAIGRTVADSLGSLAGEVIASDPFVDSETMAEHGVEKVEFETLLDRADAVTIHSPLTDETRGLFDEGAFERMRDDAVLVNVARGPIVDVDALLAALDAGEIGGAGLDVFPTEPPAADHPLCDHERVLVTPHVAWYSEEANSERRWTAAENVRAALQGETPADVVNDVKKRL